MPIIFNSDDKKTGLIRQIGDFAIELIKVVIVSLAIIIPVRYFLIQPFYVKGASMEPNFYDHEYLIINEISYRFNNPERGDIVVFKYPKDPSQYFIKRVIGLPGERVEVKNGKIIIYNKENPEGTILDESEYLHRELTTSGNTNTTLKEDEFFVMGDNRASSLDSRVFGPVKRVFFIGKAWVRGWPFDKFKIFSAPIYEL